jgi:hypothetical protein
MANRHALRPPSGHRQTLAPPPKVFFPAAIRISSHPYPLLCGYSASYVRRLSASIRQLSASIQRGSETDPACYAARFGPSETAPRKIRQIEHFKIPQEGTFRPKTAPKKIWERLANPLPSVGRRRLLPAPARTKRLMLPFEREMISKPKLLPHNHSEHREESNFFSNYRPFTSFRLTKQPVLQ